MDWGFTGFTALMVLAMFIISRTFIVVQEREKIVKERLGKFAGVLEPGFHFMVPLADRVAYRHDVREQVVDIPAQTCITRDNIQVDVDGLVYLRVMDPQKASYGIGNYRSAATNLAQTTMRSEVGKLTLDELFSEREQINESIVREIDKASSPWGIKMVRYEIRTIEPSKRIIETMEKQMEAERGKRASITVSEGQRESRIMISDGQRQEAINVSEGEKQRRINDAQGRATEIRLLADAQAEGIALIAAAIAKPGGALAVRTQLVDQYIQDFGRVLEQATTTVMPLEAAQLKTALEGISRVSDGMTGRKV